MVAASLLSTLFLALTVAAQPVEPKTCESQLVRLPFSKRFTGAVISSSAKNKLVSYIASVGVGSPPTYYDLIVDTGSSNTWLGANKSYVKTSSSSRTSNSVSVSYGSANFSGTEYTDQITIASGLVIAKQSIGVANTSVKGITPSDGIMGVGRIDQTEDTLSPDTESTIPTVTDNLYAQGTITQDVLSISFEPIIDSDSSATQMNGELTWGGIDCSKFTGNITYMPITTKFPSSIYWGIDASISYGEDTTILPITGTAGIVDTGTSSVLLATDALDGYRNITGAVLDQATNRLKITSTQYANLKSIFINVNGIAFELTPNAQIWPRKLNHVIGGTADDIYLTVQDVGNKSKSGLDFILGQAFLERFYSVYDTGNGRVGLATTRWTHATTN